MMNSTIWRTTVWACCTFVLAAPAWAVRATDAAPPSREAVRGTRQAAPMAQADDRSGLRQGVVSAISPDRRWIFVNGSWLGLVDGSTRLFRQGLSVQADALVVGQTLRFNLATQTSGRTTLGVVYVP